jgi:hypothetical protein
MMVRSSAEPESWSRRACHSGRMTSSCSGDGSEVGAHERETKVERRMWSAKCSWSSGDEEAIIFCLTSLSNRVTKIW